MNYIGYFQDSNGDNYSITIVTQDASKETTKIELARNPLVINCVSDDGIFTPIKSLGATIKIITNELYADMYSSTATGTTVTVTNDTTSTTIFRGYLTPNLYNQDYVGLDSVELEAVCALSALKNIKYVSINEVVNWYDLFKKIFIKVGYDHFFFPATYSFDENDKNDFLKILYQFEGNFFDDDDERTPWYLNEILEEFCKLYCYTLTVINDEIYFIDYNGNGEYIRYDLNNDTTSPTTISPTYTINGDTYMGTSARISFDETFNKISVKANLYESDTVLHDIDDDLKNQNVDENKYYEQTIDIDKKNYTYLNAFFNSKWWTTSREELGEITPQNIKEMYGGSFIQKCDSFPTDEIPSSLSWKTYLTTYSDGSIMSKGNDNIITSYKDNKQMILNGGYLIVDMSYYFSDNIYANNCFMQKENDEMYRENKYTTGIPNTMYPCRLYVGDYWFNGEKWISKKEFERKKAKGYYQHVYTATFNPIPTWMKYRDADGDWKFTIDKAEWDAATSEKLSGQCTDTNKVYYYVIYNELNEQVKIWVDEEYWYESNLEDRFYLVRKNKKDEKIFNEKKTLTNTVSYKMNLLDAEDGVAIQLPQHVLNGRLRFELCNPSVIGDYGQYSTDRQCTIVHAIHIDRLNLMYRAKGKEVNIFDGVKDEDVVYTNVINDEFCNEFDELELKINSQVEDRVTSMSSVLYRLPNEDYYTFLYTTYDNVYKAKRIQEESLVERYYNHHKQPRVILELTAKNIINQLFKIKENNLNRIFILDEYEIYAEENKINVKLIEL